MYRMDAFGLHMLPPTCVKKTPLDNGGLDDSADTFYTAMSETTRDGFGTSSNVYTLDAPRDMFDNYTGIPPPYSIPTSLSGTVSGAGPADGRYSYAAYAASKIAKSVGTIQQVSFLEPAELDITQTKH